MHRIREGWHRPGGVSATFHGRDIFAYAAGVLASGRSSIKDIAEVVETTIHPGWATVHKEDEHLRGEVVHVDHFGNVITNIPGQVIEDLGWGADVIVEAGNSMICGMNKAYGEVAQGEKLALIDSSGLLELAMHGRSAADHMILCCGDEVIVRKRE